MNASRTPAETAGACVEYWLLTEVPAPAVADMHRELVEHLEDAVADGKTIDEVVGDDLGEFAEAWAAEHRIVVSGRLRLLLGAGIAAAWSAVPLVGEHILDRSLRPEVGLVTLTIWPVMGVFIAFVQVGMGGLLRHHIGHRIRAVNRVFLPFLLASVVAAGVAASLADPETTVAVSWVVTAVLGLGGAAAIITSMRHPAFQGRKALARYRRAARR